MTVDAITASAIGSALSSATSLVGKHILVKWKNLGKKEAKKDAAVIIDISRPSVRTVEKFLSDQQIDAEIFVITEKEQRSHMPLERNLWEGIVKEFVRTVNGIYEVRVPDNLHIFLSAPSSLTFAMGAVIGTLWAPKVYQLNENGKSYEMVSIVSKSLLG